MQYLYVQLYNEARETKHGGRGAEPDSQDTCVSSLRKVKRQGRMQGDFHKEHSFLPLFSRLGSLPLFFLTLHSSLLAPDLPLIPNLMSSSSCRTCAPSEAVSLRFLLQFWYLLSNCRRVKALALFWLQGWRKSQAQRRALTHLVSISDNDLMHSSRITFSEVLAFQEIGFHIKCVML
jgi:hypothetical protein